MGDGDDRNAINRIPARSPGSIVRCGFVASWTGNGVKGRKPPPWDPWREINTGAQAEQIGKEGRKEGRRAGLRFLMPVFQEPVQPPRDRSNI